MFETNSSSTHTLTICSKDDFDKWKHGEVFWLDNDWHKLDTNKNFVTPEELKELAEKDYEFLYDKGLKILILGYKKFGRGIQAYNEARQITDYRIMALKELLPYMVKEKWFDSILALKQLDVKNLVPRDKWDMFYMGDEDSSTMYVDMVNREFAANSTSETRYPLWTI